MKERLIILLLMACGFCNAQTIIGGVFFTNTILTVANNPYHVTSNVLVPIGVSVTVEPGVLLYFDATISWTVEGEFQAIGNANDSIKFLLQTGNTGTWGGITYNQSAVPYNPISGTGCVMDYCVISKSEAMWINVTTVCILHSEIKNCNGGIYAYGSGIAIKHTHIHDCIYQAITTWYGFVFPLPVLIDSCEINNITNVPDALRLTSNAIFSHNCVHDITATFGALSIFEGPSINVVENNFYDNNTSAIIMVDGPDSSVSILNNNFTNNQINISKSSCYSTPIITGNNFYSYVNYNVYCIDGFGLSGPFCRPIPTGSYYTFDMQQNYFAYASTAQLDSSIYDLFDNWIGRTIITYDSNIVTPYPNNFDCSSLFDTTLLAINTSSIEQSLAVYPNPFNEKLNVLTNEEGILELILYDITGRKLLQKRFTNSITLNTEQLAYGVYIYELRNKNRTSANGKVIKQ